MTKNAPAWGYRRRGDVIESKLFPEGRPEDWADSPAKVDEKPDLPKRGRPTKKAK